jgi:DNA-binding CsgD family transcriptional regulator
MKEILTESNNRLRAELERLEAERSRFLDPVDRRIAILRQELGLTRSPGKGTPPAPHLPAADQPQRGDKRELARKLASAGKSLDIIASALGVSRSSARTHVWALKHQGKLPRDLPGLELKRKGRLPQSPPGLELSPPPRKPARQPERPREEQVFELTKQGKKANAIAEQLDVSQQTVYVHLASLRRQGRLPALTRDATPANSGATGRSGQATSTPTPEPKEAPRASQAVPPATPPEPQTPPDGQPTTRGSKIEDLRAYAVRQCRVNGTPAGPVTFLVTTGGKPAHVHRAKVNRMGDGKTERDDTGHHHEVSRFVLREAFAHDHALMLP